MSDRVKLRNLLPPKRGVLCLHPVVWHGLGYAALLERVIALLAMFTDALKSAS